jgi:hypothetical protein
MFCKSEHFILSIIYNFYTRSFVVCAVSWETAMQAAEERLLTFQRVTNMQDLSSSQR